MKINSSVFNTLPSKKDGFWQVVLFPTVTILNSPNKYDKYIAVNFEWIYWTLTLIFTNEKRRVHKF